MRNLSECVEQFGPVAGPKVFHLLKSRAAYKGVSTRRRRAIESLTGRPMRARRPRPAVEAPALPLGGEG